MPTTALPGRERSTAAILADARAKRDAPATAPTTATPHVQDVTRAAAATAHQKAGAKDGGFGMSDKLDALQLTADAVGIFDPTGIVDGLNAGVSLGRAVIEPSRAPEHLFNALVSGISVVPYLGDFAKLAKIPRAAKTATKAGKAMKGASTAAHGGTAARKGASISESLSSGGLGSILSQGPQAVFSKADRATSPNAIYSGLRHGVGPQPHAGGSFLHRHIVSPMMRGASSLFRRGKGHGGAAAASTRRSPTHGPTPPASGATQMPWWQEPPVIPQGTPSGERGEMLITSILREKWQSIFGTSAGGPGRGASAAAAPPGSRPAAGRGGSAAPPGSPPRRPTATGSPGDGGDDRWWKRIIGMFSGQQPPGGQAAAGSPGPMSPPPQRPGERIAGVFGSWLGNNPSTRQRQPIAAHEVLREGTNFGDVMGGKKSLKEAEEEVQGNRELAEGKQKLAEAIKGVTGRLGAMAVAAVGLVKVLKSVNVATIAKQMHLAEYSPGHAFAATKREAHQIRQNIAHGRETAGSFARLVDEQNDLERALAPTNAILTNIQNNLLAVLTDWTAKFVEELNKFTRENGKTAETAAKAAATVVGGAAAGAAGGIGGHAAADAAIRAGKALADGKPKGPQPEPWQKLWDDLADGKYKRPSSPRKL